MFCDVHVHLCKSVNKCSNTFRSYATTAYKNDIFKAVVFPYPLPLKSIDKIKEANRYIMEAFKNHMELFVPFFLITNDELRFIEIDKIMGFKEHFTLDPPREDFFFPAYDFLQDNGLFLMIHPGSAKKLSPERLTDLKIKKVENIKKNFPRLKIILAHSGRNLPFHAQGVKEVVLGLRRYEDVYFDTSTIRCPKAIEEMVEIVGSDRILFGSDYPYHKIAGEDIYSLEKDTILKADISDAEKDDIFRKNFTRLFLKKVWVRRVCNEDVAKILFLIDTLPELDRKHLAITRKMDKIKRCIEKQNHMYILENKEDKIIGFIRVSERHNNGALIEEIVVAPDARGRGLGRILMEVVTNKYSYVEAKTFVENTSINRLNEKMGFKVEKKSTKGNILYWKKERFGSEGDFNAQENVKV